MRTLIHNGFFLDIGRKELYSRNPIVHQFCTEILGPHYRTYPRRFASLYRGRIIEQSGAYRSFTRGMPIGMFIRVAADVVLSRIRYTLIRPKNYAEWVYGGTGRLYSQITEQAYWEKIQGKPWSEMPVPAADGRPRRLRFGGLGEMLSRAHGAAVPVTEWRHPARGAGQICTLLEGGAADAGARFEFQCAISNLETDADRVTAVTVRTPTGTMLLRPEHVVSSLPIQALTALLPPHFRPAHAHDGSPPKRSTRLVYLFLREPPRFPHAWLEVSSPDLRVGRVTNFAGFNGDMVPQGHTCLCVEYFCTGDDPLLAVSDDALRDLALREMASAHLVDPAACFDTLVLTLPGADAAINLRAWKAAVQPYLDALRPLSNLYYINRPSTDQALFAGLLAADAVINGNRRAFDTTPWG
jgi:protoporphyrinogen oxidase